MLIHERIAEIKILGQGAHPSSPEENPDRAMCAMEAVAYIAGEPWSDHPECACPVISAFMRAWNDGLSSDADRSRLLLPLIPKIVGTRGSKTLETRRATLACDWLVRVHTPAWLRLAKLDAQAAGLEALPEIVDLANCPPLMLALEAARGARDAASAAAWDAAWDAARDAASAAASAAAWDAAWDAARDAARDALSETRQRLEASAVALVERMIAATD